MSEETNPIASVDEDGTIKLDLRQNAVQEQSTDEVPVRDEPAVSEEVPAENLEQPAEEPAGEETPVEEPVEQQPVLQEITEEEVEQSCVNEGALLCFQGLTDRRITVGATYRF